MSQHGTHPGEVMPIEIRAERPMWSRSVRLYMRRITVGVKVDRALPLQWESISSVEAEFLPEFTPAIELPDLAAQQLMDELWQCGFRPSEGTDSTGSLAATQAHLKDMRALVFDHLIKTKRED